MISFQADMKALEEREVELKKEMTSLKERNHSLEQMVNELLTKGNQDLVLLVSTFMLTDLQSVGVIRTGWEGGSCSLEVKEQS